MSDDLLERLEKWARQLAMSSEGGLLAEAAARIRKLKREREVLSRSIVGSTGCWCGTRGDWALPWPLIPIGRTVFCDAHLPDDERDGAVKL